MLVKECIELAAVKLGLQDSAQGYFEGTASMEDEKKGELLLACFNIVENELAVDYFPLIAEDTLQTESGVIEFSALQKSAVRIVKVMDEWDNNTPFQLFASYLKTQPGKVRVRYTYAPNKKEKGDEGEFAATVSARLVSCGIAAEYSMATGIFEDAAVWDKKYKEGIQAAYRLQKCERIRSRRWV